MMGFNLQLGDALRSESVTAIDDAIREIVRQEIARTPRSKFCESCAYMHQPEISARCCCVACHGDDVPAWAQRMNTPPSIEKTGDASPASEVKACPFGPVEASVERFLRAIEARLDVDDDDAHILSRDGLELLKIAWSNRRTPAPSPAGDPGDWTCRCGRHVSWPGLVCAACGHEHPWKPAPSPATGESASPPSEQTAKELDELLAVFAKGDGDDEDCWTQPARRAQLYVASLRADLNDAQVQEFMHRSRGDVLAEINAYLRAEVDTRNITIDHLAAENAAMREALGRIVRCVHGTEIVRDTLPAGYGVSSDEVGSPGPWYGLRLESGEERGWSRSYFKMRLADVGAYEPDADFLASIARAALAEKEDRRG